MFSNGKTTCTTTLLALILPGKANSTQSRRFKVRNKRPLVVKPELAHSFVLLAEARELWQTRFAFILLLLLCAESRGGWENFWKGK